MSLTSSPMTPIMAPNPCVEVVGMSKKGKYRLDPQRNRWIVYIAWKGKRYYFSSYNGVPCYVKEMATQLLSEIRGEINRGVFNPLKYKKAKPMHFKSYSKAWLERKRKILASNTIHDYENSLDNYLYPILGDPLLEDINYDKLEDLQAKITRKPKGKKNTMYCLYAILRDAKKSGYIAQLPERPSFTGEDSVIPPDIEYIETDDIETILARIPAPDRMVFEFIRLTGCRTSEARAMQWDCIKDDHVLIRETFGREEELKTVKNRKPRKIPRYSLLDDFIKSLPHTHSPFIFINPRTNKHYGRDFSDLWRKACRDAGLKAAPLRLLRHSLGCNLLNMDEGNIDLEDLRRLYGHSNIQMTKRYAERSTRALKLKLDNVFSLASKRASEHASKLQADDSGVKNAK